MEKVNNVKLISVPKRPLVFLFFVLKKAKEET